MHNTYIIRSPYTFSMVFVIFVVPKENQFHTYFAAGAYLYLVMGIIRHQMVYLEKSEHLNDNIKK